MVSSRLLVLARSAWVVAAGTLLSGCAWLGILAPSDPLDALRTDLDRLLSDSLFRPTIASVKIISLKTNEVLYERNSVLLLRPASNTKLLTTAAALLTLGKDFQFRTLLAADSVSSPGIVEGNVYLKGFGDPDLATQDLDSLAARTAARGIQGIRGDLIVDASYFDGQYWGSGWMWDDEPDPDGAPISALSLNKNCIRLTVYPDSATRSVPIFQLDPPTSYVTIVNCARIVPDSAVLPLTVRRLFEERSNTIAIEGELPANSEPVPARTTVWQPEMYAGQVLRESLERRGISMSGTVRYGIMPDSARPVAEFRHPIDSMVVHLNKVSDNLSAENTLKTLAAMNSRLPGTSAGGWYAVNQALSNLGIDTTSYRFVDGSGISHYNLVTASTLVQLLQAMYHQPAIFPLFYASLPVAGVDGTLARRMRGTPAEGNLRAKTGTIAGVTSLSGYVTTRDRELLAFSMMMQNFIRSTGLYRAVQDTIGARLAGFSRSTRFLSRR